MKRLKGTILSKGYAEGTAFLYGIAVPAKPTRYQIKRSEVFVEHQRFERALRCSIRDLEKLKDRVLVELGETESGIFDAHLALLSDPEFVEKVKARVGTDLVNVEHAVDRQVCDLEKLLLAVKSEYLRERTQDIRDVGQRVLKHLNASGGKGTSSLRRLPEISVIIARELLPSDTFQLDRTNVVGIVTEKGGPSSHAAILSRSLGIPAITGIRDITRKVSAGDRVLVDGRAGTVTITPSRQSISGFRKSKEKYDASLNRMRMTQRPECVTADGVRVYLFGNLGRAEEACLVKEHDLEGVGLFWNH